MKGKAEASLRMINDESLGRYGGEREENANILEINESERMLFHFSTLLVDYATSSISFRLPSCSRQSEQAR